MRKSESPSLDSLEVIEIKRDIDEAGISLGNLRCR